MELEGRGVCGVAKQCRKISASVHPLMGICSSEKSLGGHKLNTSSLGTTNKHMSPNNKKIEKANWLNQIKN